MFWAGVVSGIVLGLLFGTWVFSLRQSAKHGLDELNEAVSDMKPIESYQ